MWDQQLDHYLNGYLFDTNNLNPNHLNSIRVSLLAFYRSIKEIEIKADTNECKMWVYIRFKWYYIFLRKNKVCVKIKKMLENELPYSYRIVGERKGQPIADYVSYSIEVCRLGRKGKEKKWY